MIFLLENIRSKHNIGSVFRTCDAFQVEQLILTWYCVFPPDKDISKTAIWAESVVNWKYFQRIEDAIFDLKKQWRKIIAIEINEKAKNIDEFKFKWNEVFIFWNEIEWVSVAAMDLSDEIIKIPMKWKVKESLNVWVTAGIVWSRVFSQLTN